MNVVKKLGLKPIKLWLDDIEDGAMAQAEHLAELPFIHSHIVLMPDCHQGYGMPIGGVMATEGVVVPNAVGVDIGCGMCAVKTDLREEEVNVKTVLGHIRQVVPVGFKSFSKNQLGMPTDTSLDVPGVYLEVVSRQFSKAHKSLGTLGGGNHFIELQVDEEGFVWVMIHSGSRNLGFQVAKHYNDLAKELNARWYTRVTKSWELAFLPLDTQEATDYLEEMNYCVKYAFANRMKMMDAVLKHLSSGSTRETFQVEEPINIAHNYARMEHHFGRNVMIHRKGATSATCGEIGIIPGSQGTASYIVRGLGNPDSFMSCSHGAGRKMGRKQACRELDLEEQQAILNSQGIVHGIRTAKDLDEAPGAYKDINVVMENQKDLVEIVTKLKPIAVIKG
jgi:tRNA-splicing ligase RtcB